MIYLRQSTASQEVPLGRFVDSTDGNTEETGLTIANTDIKIWKTGATTLANKNSGGATHIANGIYYAVLDATDTDTIGPMTIHVHVSGALYIKQECCVLDEAVFDVLFGTTAPSTYAGADTSGTTTLLSRIGGAITITSGRVNADVTHWLGTAAATPTVAGVPEVDITHLLGTAWLTPGTAGTPDVNMRLISGDATAADNLETMLDGTGGQTLSLGSLVISAATGDAVSIITSGGDGDGISITANGSGEGINITPGATGNGLRIRGGATSGNGMYVTGTAGQGHGIFATGHGIGNGMRASGGDTGDGFQAVGGATSGDGMQLSGTGSAGRGLNIQGNISGAGLSIEGGDTGVGVNIYGGGTSGDALRILSFSGDAVKISTSNGHGVNIAAVGTDMHGITIDADAGNGIHSQGGGAWHGMHLSGGATGDGLFAQGGANGDGMHLDGQGTGIDLRGDLPWTASWDAEVQSECADALVAYDALVPSDLPISVNVTQISGDSTAADNAESFFDGTGYAGTGNVIPTVTTLTNLPAITPNWLTAAGTAADFGTEVGAAVLSALGTGTWLTAIPWNSSWDTEVQSEVQDAIVANGLDHLIAASVTGSDVTDNSIIAYLASKSATADWDSFINTTDSLEAIRDRGDAAWGAGAVPSVADIADGVWDEAISGHLAAGSTGASLNAAGSAGDPWTTTLPGSYTGSQAGKMLSDILTDTAVIGSAGAGLTAIPWNSSWDTEVQSEVQDAIESNNLDHLVKVAVDTNFATTVHLDSVIGQIADNGTTATFDRTTDSLESVRDRGDAAWITATGFSTHSAADIWAVGTRTLTAGTNIDGSTFTSIPWNAAWDIEVQSECADALIAYDALVPGDLPISVNVIQISGDSTAADNLEAMLDGTGGVNLTIGTMTVSTNSIAWNSGWDTEVQSEVDDALKATLAEGYRATGSVGSVRDMMYEIIGHLGESSISGTTKTVKKLDGSTTAKTYTLDSSTTPTSITETT